MLALASSLIGLGQRQSERADHGVDEIGDHRLDGVGHQLSRRRAPERQSMASCASAVFQRRTR